MNPNEKIVPNLFIVGAAKAGTTSLYYYLGEHPDVLMSSVKEPLFFNDTSDKMKKVSDWAEYLKLFSRWNGEIIIGEASPSYLYYPKSPEKIKKKVRMRSV